MLQGYLLVVHESSLHREESVSIETDFIVPRFSRRHETFVTFILRVIQLTVHGFIMLNYSAYWIGRLQNGFLFTNALELHLQANTVSHVVTLISLGAVNCCVVYTQQTFRSYS
jgi:hypothetical protein